MAADLRVSWCGGECGITLRSHEQGFVFMDVLHFRDRRFTRRGAKNFLMLAASLERHRVIPEAEYHTPRGLYLNDPDRFDYLYFHDDAVRAQAMAGQLGFRIPAHLFDAERERCLLLARKRGVTLPPTIRAWAKRQ
jgi:hypothetical protein